MRSSRRFSACFLNLSLSWLSLFTVKRVSWKWTCWLWSFQLFTDFCWPFFSPWFIFWRLGLFFQLTLPLNLSVNWISSCYNHVAFYLKLSLFYLYKNHLEWGGGLFFLIWLRPTLMALILSFCFSFIVLWLKFISFRAFIMRLALVTLLIHNVNNYLNDVYGILFDTTDSEWVIRRILWVSKMMQ